MQTLIQSQTAPAIIELFSRLTGRLRRAAKTEHFDEFPASPQARRDIGLAHGRHDHAPSRDAMLPRYF